MHNVIEEHNEICCFDVASVNYSASVFKHSFLPVFVGLGVESSKVVESQLADFLVFLRRVLSLRVMKRLSTFVKWIDPLMAIISHKCSLGKTILR